MIWSNFVFAFALHAASSEGQHVIRVAVASNFAPTLEALLEDTPPPIHADIQISAGSTGKLFAQIVNGAPFDLFLAADVYRPSKLVQMGLTASSQPDTYAAGQLALWGPKESDGADSCKAALKSPERIALANPRLAPYGLAAQQTLQKLELWPLATPPAKGENVTQAYAFVSTGNARLGFVAASLLTDLPQGCVWLVEASYHDPILQAAVVLKSDNPDAQRLLGYLLSDETQARLEQYGYRQQP